MREGVFPLPSFKITYKEETQLLRFKGKIGLNKLIVQWESCPSLKRGRNERFVQHTWKYEPNKELGDQPTDLEDCLQIIDDSSNT